MAVTYTYNNAAIREDLLNVITNLDFKEYQLVSGLGTSKAEQPLHQWLTDTLKTPGFNAFVEGVDASYPARTNPARLTNWTQIIRIGFSISDSDQAANTAGFSSRYQTESTKALKEFKQDLEFALMRGSLACGTGSAARQMVGIKNFLNLVTSESGVSLTEVKLNDYLQNSWTQGVECDALYVPMYLKRKISAFTAGNTKNVPAEDRRLVNSVDIYQADAAKNLKLFAHRFVTQSGDTNYDMVGIKEDMFKIAYYRKPDIRELAKTGDATNSEVVGEATLECLHRDSGFWTKALL